MRLCVNRKGGREGKLGARASNRCLEPVCGIPENAGPLYTIQVHAFAGSTSQIYGQQQDHQLNLLMVSAESQSRPKEKFRMRFDESIQSNRRVQV